MTLKFTPDGKVDRVMPKLWNDRENDLADALDECVAALREIAHPVQPNWASSIAEDALRKIGAEK